MKDPDDALVSYSRLGKFLSEQSSDNKAALAKTLTLLSECHQQAAIKLLREGATPDAEDQQRLADALRQIPDALAAAMSRQEGHVENQREADAGWGGSRPWRT